MKCKNMKQMLLLAAFGFVLAIPAQAADVDTVFECIVKVAPEGQEPGAPPPPDDQTCIGLIADPCRKAGGDSEKCNARETKAWLAAIDSIQASSKSDYGKKQSATFEAGTAALLQNAVALCRAAAATSAWGSEAIAKDSDWVAFDSGDICVRQSVAQQALIVLTRRMGI